jgi:hypothetical protein
MAVGLPAAGDSVANWAMGTYGELMDEPSQDEIDASHVDYACRSPLRSLTLSWKADRVNSGPQPPTDMGVSQTT